MRLLVIAGRRSGGLLGGGALRTFSRRLDHFNWSWSEATLDEVLADPGRLQDADDVAVVGGDGTLRALLAVTHPRPILVVPAGTGNDFARALGIDSPLDSANLLRRGRRRRIDLGTVTHDGGTERFANGVGVGIDGIVAARHAAGLPYALGAALSLVNLPRWMMRLDVDGARCETAALSIGVANGAFCGGGFRMAPEARLDDGLLDVIGVRPISTRDYLAWLPRARAGRHLDHPAVFTHRGARIVIEADEPLPFHVDGEPRHSRTIAIEVRPGDREFYAGEQD